jgi:hypothetical protein
MPLRCDVMRSAAPPLIPEPAGGFGISRATLFNLKELAQMLVGAGGRLDSVRQFAEGCLAEVRC